MQVTKYWKMAGFQTMVMPRVEKNILKQVDMYNNINKHRARNSQTEILKREEYMAVLGKLFDIARQDLEEILKKDRLLAADDKDKRYRVKEGYTRKMEDISFLIDQRTERKMLAMRKGWKRILRRKVKLLALE